MNLLRRFSQSCYFLQYLVQIVLRNSIAVELVFPIVMSHNSQEIYLCCIVQAELNQASQ